jgi:anti-sigma regulatory factor (Ser/Thr protein kinase)
MVKRYATSAEHPAEARRIVRSALREAPDEIVEAVELLTSELITNAIIHGSSEPELILEVDAGSVRVEVQDRDPRLNLQALQVEPSSEHGRGLAIVDALASSWGIEPQGPGKVVWFQMIF